MGSSEKFCLRWNDFESNISVAFREIREEKDFFDCTLSCGSRQIQAHKLILSACSPFFRSILKQNPHQHPLLYLKGVQFPNLLYVLNFMYHGEVNVAQEELNSFLSVAEELQVKGLTQNNSQSNAASNPKPELVHKLPSQKEHRTTPPPKRQRPLATTSGHPVYQAPPQDEIQEIVSIPVVKTEPLQVPVSQGEESIEMPSMEVPSMEVASIEENYAVEGFNNYEVFDGQDYYEGEDGQGYEGYGDMGMGTAEQNKGLINFIVSTESGFSCTECGKHFSDQSNCRRHVREKHFGQDQDTCGICNKQISKRNIARHVENCRIQN